MKVNVMISRIAAWAPRLCLLLAIAAGVAACDKGEDVSLEQRMDRAKEARGEGDLRTAILELKNALRENPDSAAARYFLGQIYIDMENGAAAEKELTQAQRLGVDAEAVLVPLSRAWILQAKYEKVLEEVKISINLPAPTQGALQAVRGDAYFGTGDIAQAENAYRLAVQADPSLSAGYVGVGNVALHTRKMDEAKAALAKALELDPNNLRVITLEGDVFAAQGKYEDAVKTYKRLVKARPENVFYKTVLAWAQANEGEYEEATQNIDRVLAIVPDYPPANHVKAVIAFQTKQYASARDHASQVLSAEPDRMPTLLILGASSYALGSMEQAYNSLRRYVSAIPGSTVGRKLLSQVQIALGRSDEALETLNPLLDDEEGGDTELFGLVAQASLMQGDLATGRAYLERSLKSQPGSAATLATLGRTQIALGNVEEGLNQMEKAVALNPKDFARRMLLAVEYLRSNKADKALEAGRAMQELAPDRATGFTIAGLALAMKGDKEASQGMFGKALEVEPGNPNASFNLIRFAVVDEQWDRVQDLLDGILKVHPKDKKALLAYAELMKRQEKPAAVRDYLERAVAANPGAREPTILLGQDYFAAGDYLKGLEVTRKLLPVYPKDPVLLELVGRLEMGADQFESALVTFGALTEVRPGSPVAHYLLALALERQGNWIGVERSLDRVLEIDPSHVAARFAMTRVLASKGEFEKAEALLGKLAQEYPDDPDFVETRGVIAALRGDYDTAINAFKRALEVRENNINIRRLAEAYAKSGDVAAAQKVMWSWLERHPDDFATRFFLAGQMLAMGDMAGAEAQYRRLVKQWPDNAATLNNLAYLLNETGKTGEAVTLIERALALAPDNTDVLDTAGGVYLRAGRAQESISAFRKASDLAPRNTTIRQRYAKALIADGRTVEAREVLKGILGSPYPVADRDKLEKLYIELSSE